MVISSPREDYAKGIPYHGFCFFYVRKGSHAYLNREKQGLLKGIQIWRGDPTYPISSLQMTPSSFVRLLKRRVGL